MYGISSLPPYDFTLLAVPGDNPVFTWSTLPSLAVHEDSGNIASVSFFGLVDAGGGTTKWRMFSTGWEMDNDTAWAATNIELAADGQFDATAILDFIFHDYGSGSSLAMVGNNTYWAAWSDRIGTAAPCRIVGSMGYPQ